MELFADDVAAFMQAIGVERAHVSGLSLGAATGLWLAAKYPERVKSLSLHSGWTKTDPFLKTVVEGWQSIAKGLGSVQEMVIQGIFPWCFTPEFYAAKPDYIDQLAAFVRGRPKQPLDAFIRQSNAVIAHDAVAQLAHIKAPTQITFGRHDLVCLAALRRRDEERHQGERTCGVRDLRACSHLSKRGRVQREDLELPEPSHRLGPHADGGFFAIRASETRLANCSLGLGLVHRRLRHARPAGGQGAAR